MGKKKDIGPMTAKAIISRQKKNALHKLKWYCQLCQKQCRDDRSFRAHNESEGHQRKLQIFRTDGKNFLNDFSQRFEAEFLLVLQGFKTFTRINLVYQEVIKNRQHVHLNATKWGTLTGFCGYLADKGKAELEERESGFFIKSVPQESREEAERRTECRVRKKEHIQEQKHVLMVGFVRIKELGRRKQLEQVQE